MDEQYRSNSVYNSSISSTSKKSFGKLIRLSTAYSFYFFIFFFNGTVMAHNKNYTCRKRDIELNK